MRRAPDPTGADDYIDVVIRVRRSQYPALAVKAERAGMWTVAEFLEREVARMGPSNVDTVAGEVVKMARGKFTDSQIAARTGLDRSQVAYHRRNAGIAATREADRKRTQRAPRVRSSHA